MNNILKNKESEVKASRLIAVCMVLLFLSVGVRAVIIGGKDGGYYNGTIDEVRIWSIGLFAEQHYYSNLYRHSTSGWSFYSNQSNLTVGDYTYQGCAEDISGNINCTEVRSLEIEMRGLVSWWKFDETSLNNGETAYDSEDGNDGTVYADNDVAFDDKFRGRVARFADSSGDDDNVNITTNGFSTSQGSVGLWFKPEDLSGTQYLFSHHDGVDDDSRIYLIVDNGNIKTELGGLGVFRPEDTLVDAVVGKWTHLHLTWNGTNQKAYVDGILRSDDTYSDLNVIMPNAYIGSSKGVSQSFNGSIDDVQVWNIALDETEIWELYQSQLNDITPPEINFTWPTPENGSTQDWDYIPVNVTARDYQTDVSVFVDFDDSLVGWWRMDDLCNGKVCDNSSQGNDGTIYDAKQGEGYLGKGMEFDGVNDYVSISDDNSIDPKPEMTISAWVKPIEMTGAMDIVSKSPGDGTSQYILRTNLGGDGSLDLLMNDGDKRGDLVGVSSIGTNVWSHIVGVFSISDDNIRLYINGTEVASAALSADPKGVSSANLEIGRDKRNADYFNGTIDDVMIFNRSLSADEIRGLYANQTSKYLAQNFTSLADGSYTFKAYAQDRAGNVNSTSRTVVVETIEEGAPIINEVKCYNSTSWSNCSDIAYGINLTQIRVNCTDVNYDIANVSYLMANLDDNDVKIDDNATYSDGDYWYYNYNEFILDSGDWSLNISCLDSTLLGDNYSESWSLAYGVLEPYVVSGNMDVAFNTSFNFTVGVRCAGGECGNVNATLDPIEILKLGHSVNVQVIEEYKTEDKIGIIPRFLSYLWKLKDRLLNLEVN